MLSFLAATVLPVGSEVFFSAMILGKYDALWCLILASIGNTLGGMTNYYLGRLGKVDWLKKNTRLNAKKVDAVFDWVRLKGCFGAFFSFMPIVGDVIAFVLGYFRSPVFYVFFLMFLGKFLRYVFLIFMLV